jgi:hypothetical protein
MGFERFCATDDPTVHPNEHPGRGASGTRGSSASGTRGPSTNGTRGSSASGACGSGTSGSAARLATDWPA